jgi:hypothetical protein
MNGWRRSWPLGLALLATLAVAGGAYASFSASIDAGALSVQTATLDAPSGLTAVVECSTKGKGYDRVALSWNASTSPAVIGYEVDRSDDGGATYAPVARVTTRSTKDSTVTGPETAYYEVWAYNHNWTSTPLSSVSVYVPNASTCV